MALLSKNYPTSHSLNRWAPDMLLGIGEEKVRGVKDAVVVSAYYSTEFIKYLFKKIDVKNRKECKALFIFNGLSGLRLTDQIKDLKKLKKDLSKIGFSQNLIQIYLNKKFDIFHPKIYYFVGENMTVWSIGSANASTQAFQKNGNEEIIYQKVSFGKKKTQEMTALIDYVNEILDDSERGGDCFEIDKFNDDQLEKNLISFFRSGLIYFKPMQQLQYTFGEVKFASEIEDQLSRLSDRPENTDKGKLWGPLNLLSILGIGDINDFLEIETSRLSIKPWSIETCYGFWVPSAYANLVDKKLNLKEQDRIEKFKLIKNVFNNKNNGSALQSAFNNYIDQINSIFKSNLIAHTIDSDKRDEYLKKFNKFLINFDKRINDEKFMRRYTKPLIASGMPEIWQDDVAYEDFKYSYFEYLSYAASRRPPLIAKKIMMAIRMQAPILMDSDDIENNINKFIQKNGWSAKYWD